jgi:hypothetical protein
MSVNWGFGGTEIKRSNRLNQSGPSNERELFQRLLCTSAVVPEAAGTIL